MLGDSWWPFLPFLHVCAGLNQSSIVCPGCLRCSVVMRYSAMNQLAWYRNENYRAIEMDTAQEELSRRLAHSVVVTGDQVRAGGGDPLRHLLASMMLPFCSRGGGRVEDMRLEILHIMRRHNIRDGIQGGIEDPFLDQWRQKLHNNSSPDDIIIADAYIAFLERCAFPSSLCFPSELHAFL